MHRNKNTFPGFEDPLDYAVSLAESISGEKHSADKQKLGQYFTPSRLAEYTADCEEDYLLSLSGTVRILDPGTGTGILSCALIKKMAENKKIIKIELYCYEIDRKTADCARQSLEYLSLWLGKKGVSFIYNLNNSDFISEHSPLINAFPETFSHLSDKFDIIISNPPFYKLGTSHPYIASASFNFRYHLNIYHLFLFVSANLLKDSGRMLFIIPSVFFAGGYFQELRKIILRLVSVEKVLFFRSPGGIFEHSSKLADTAVISFSVNKAVLREKIIKITAYESFHSANGFEYPFNYDPQINRLPFFTGKDEMQIFKKVDGWPSTVYKSGYHVNAGHLLFTEASSVLSSAGKNSDVKVLYLFLNKALDHKNMGSENQTYCTDQVFCPSELPGYVQHARNLVVIRRYNSAGALPVQSSPFFNDDFESAHLAVDKRLLYLDRPGCAMTRAETAGLTIILNSRLIREYIHITYGKINLTIQEFLDLPLPSENVILRAGELFLSSYF